MRVREIGGTMSPLWGNFVEAGRTQVKHGGLNFVEAGRTHVKHGG